MNWIRSFWVPFLCLLQWALFLFLRQALFRPPNFSFLSANSKANWCSLGHMWIQTCFVLFIWLVGQYLDHVVDQCVPDYTKTHMSGSFGNIGGEGISQSWVLTSPSRICTLCSFLHLIRLGGSMSGPCLCPAFIFFPEDLNGWLQWEGVTWRSHTHHGELDAGNVSKDSRLTVRSSSANCYPWALSYLVLEPPLLLRQNS